MNTKNTTKNMGALAPTKKPVFSTTIVEKDARIRIVTNAPQNEQQQQREIRRVRAD